MKIPPRPPDPISVLTKDPKRLSLLSLRLGIVDEKGRYLPWDELRFKKPPADMSVKEWWAVTRLTRGAVSQTLPLDDDAKQNFSFCEPPSLKAALRELDMSTGGALASDATVLSTGEGKLHLARSLAEEPFASSFIEGAATTRQIAKKLILEKRTPRTKDERMVLNNYLALEFVKQHRDENLTLPMLLELHRIMTEGTLDDPADAGRIRTADDVQVVDGATNEILHQPPLAANLPARLERLMKFANRKASASNWVHPLLKACILHFMLSYEHPFVDGNGRVARALFYWLALRERYWLIEYVSISSVIAQSKVAYGRAFLNVETDSLDLTYFLIYHAHVLQTAVVRLTEFVERKRKEVTALERRLADRADAFNHRQSWLLNEFARNRLERVTIAEHEERNGVSYLTARSDLEALLKLGFLRKTKSGKSSIYSPARDLLRRLSTPG